MDLGAILTALWISLSSSLGGEALALAFIVGFVIFGLVAFYVTRAITKTKFYERWGDLWLLVDDQIADLIFLIEFGDVNLDEYTRRAQERLDNGESWIDPRMLYVLDRVQQLVKEQLHVELDLEQLLARAERLLDEIKNNPSNGVGGTPAPTEEPGSDPG